MPEQKKTRRGFRYSPAMGDRLVGAVRELGSARAAMEALDIPSGTYYAWLREHTDLRMRVEIAKREFCRLQDSENIRMAKGWLLRLLKEGDITIKKTVRQVVVKDQVVDIKETSRTERPCPNWVIDRVLGTGGELNAVQVLATSGFIPDNISAEVMDAIDRVGEEIKDAFERGLENEAE